MDQYDSRVHWGRKFESSALIGDGVFMCDSVRNLARADPIVPNAEGPLRSLTSPSQAMANCGLSALPG